MTCPQCGKARLENRTLNEFLFQRTCKSCSYSIDRTPPPLNKKLIYLDQFAYSMMLKTLNPNLRSANDARGEPYLKLFQRLDSLRKLHLIVCPDSSYHHIESGTWEHETAVRRLTDFLSAGVSFHDANFIRTSQVYYHAIGYITKACQDKDIYDVENVLRDRLNCWLPLMQVICLTAHDMELATVLRSELKAKDTALGKLFARWKTDAPKTFDEFLEIEFNDFGTTIANSIGRHLKRRTEALHAIPINLDALHPPREWDYAINIRRAFQKHGVPEDELGPKAVEYLCSSDTRTIPFNNIESHLFAAIGYQASSFKGKAEQKKSPVGMTDIQMLGVILPYVDAAFIDNKCYNLLTQKPLQGRLTYKAKIFCSAKMSNFMKYLDEIEASASPEHIAFIGDVYGEAWKKPSNRTFV